MPSLGADMEEGVLLEWLVQPGATVHKGDVVAVVDTAKAAVEVECFASGVVDRLVVQPGQRVPVGAVLATIAELSGTEAAAATAAPAAPPVAVTVAQPAVPEESPVTSPLVRHLAAARHIDLHTVPGTGVGGRITHADVEQAATATGAGAPPRAPGDGRRRVSPLARRLAGELGVYLAGVTGTGREGAIEAEDVRRAAVAAAPSAIPSTVEPEPERVDRSAAIRAAIAALMARSKREIPHYYLAETTDLGRAMDWLHERNRRLPVNQRLVPAALLLKAAALALRAVPELSGGLVAPAIHDAADLDLATLMARMRDLVIRTRAGRLRRAELNDPTITVSNMGEQGAETIFGVIYPPQVALVGFGRIADRPWAVDGLIGVRPTVSLSLAADHRATDGATGARYLQTVIRLLHTPEEL